MNDLTDIAARLNQIVADAEGFNKPLRLVLAELSDFADELEDLFQDQLEEQAAQFEYNRQFDTANDIYGDNALAEEF